MMMMMMTLIIAMIAVVHEAKATCLVSQPQSCQCDG